MVSTGKRKRQRERREAREEAEHPVRSLTDDDLSQLLVEVTVRADCDNSEGSSAFTRYTGCMEVSAIGFNRNALV